MNNYISSAVENFHQLVDPSYRGKKEEINKATKTAGLICTAGMVSSATLLILGLSSGGLAGISFTGVGVPLGYLAHNGYKVCQNFQEIIDNPKKYVSFTGSIKKEDIKEQLKKNTFYFDFVIDTIVDSYIAARKEHKASKH